MIIKGRGINNAIELHIKILMEFYKYLAKITFRLAPHPKNTWIPQIETNIKAARRQRGASVFQTLQRTKKPSALWKSRITAKTADYFFCDESRRLPQKLRYKKPKRWGSSIKRVNFISRELKKNQTAHSTASLNRVARCSAPAKRKSPRSVGALLDKGLVKLPIRWWMDERPTVLAVVL